VFFSTFSCSISTGVQGFGWLLYPAPHFGRLGRFGRHFPFAFFHFSGS
jgi:hypothetical protein